MKRVARATRLTEMKGGEGVGLRCQFWESAGLVVFGSSFPSPPPLFYFLNRMMPYPPLSRPQAGRRHGLHTVS